MFVLREREREREREGDLQMIGIMIFPPVKFPKKLDG